jgi:hypothetical protein
MSRTVVVRRCVDLPAPAGAVFAAVRTPAAFRIVTRGLIRLTGLAGRDEPWREGESDRGVLLLFGVIPVSVHRITAESIDPDARVLQSDESGGLIRSWRHRITVAPIDERSSRYEDLIEIDAGIVTPFIAIRQRRWRELADVLAEADRRRRDEPPA